MSQSSIKLKAMGQVDVVIWKVRSSHHGFGNMRDMSAIYLYFIAKRPCQMYGVHFYLFVCFLLTCLLFLFVPNLSEKSISYLRMHGCIHIVLSYEYLYQVSVSLSGSPALCLIKGLQWGATLHLRQSIQWRCQQRYIQMTWLETFLHNEKHLLTSYIHS